MEQIERFALGEAEEIGEVVFGQVKSKCAVWCKKIIALIGEFFFVTTGYCTFCVLAILLSLGIFSFYDIVVGDDVPPVAGLMGRFSSDRELAYLRAAYFDFNEFRDSEGWLALQNSLVLLDSVAPHVSTWVREQYQKGLIIWKPGETRLLASYDNNAGRLSISKYLFSENNGTVASILAHEYRHSRQSDVKFFRNYLTFFILGKYKEDLIEDDAVLYEYQVYFAIFAN